MDCLRAATVQILHRADCLANGVDLWGMLWKAGGDQGGGDSGALDGGVTVTLPSAARGLWGEK